MDTRILMLILQGKDLKDKDIIVVVIRVAMAINTNSKTIITLDSRLVVKEDNHIMHLHIEVAIEVVAKEEEEVIKAEEVVNVVAMLLEVVIIIMMAANNNTPNIIKTNLNMVRRTQLIPHLSITQAITATTTTGNNSNSKISTILSQLSRLYHLQLSLHLVLKEVQIRTSNNHMVKTIQTKNGIITGTNLKTTIDKQVHQ